MNKNTSGTAANEGAKAGGGVRAGFTLVELLVVIGIIAVMVAMLLPVLTKARASASEVACGANLRSLYVAQQYYADVYGRYTPVNYFNEIAKSWPELLRPMLSKTRRTTGKASDFGGAMRVIHCEVVPEELRIDGAYSYGLNPFTGMPSWAGKRGKKADMTRLILMADKGLSENDTLRTEDRLGYYYSTRLLQWIYEYEQHTNVGGVRHSSARLDVGRYVSDPLANRYNPRGVMAVLADGHVEKLDRRELLLKSGRWVIGDASQLVRMPYPGECCK